MKTVSTILVLASAAAAFAYTDSLTNQFSDSANPTGRWTLEQAPGSPFSTNFPDYFSDNSLVHAWAAQPFPQPQHVPFWIRVSTFGPLNGLDLLVGDVVMHGAEVDRTGSFNSSAVWTSNISGTVSISGKLWQVRNLNRTMNWSLQKNNIMVSSGVLNPGASDRANPVMLSSGSGGPLALSQNVIPGDKLELRLTSANTNLGEMVAVDFSINDNIVTPTVTGVVDLGQVGGTPYNTGDGLPSTLLVSWRDAANQEIVADIAAYNPVTGAFSASVPGAVTGPFRLSIKQGFWLRATVPNPNNPAHALANWNFGTVSPLVGDADFDNEITNGDYALWASGNGNSVSANSGCDFDGDAEVTNSDYALWAANNGSSGDN